MRYKIENEHLQVELDSLGGELKRVVNRKDGYEYIWPGDKEFWSNSSPVLFPIVGNLNNGRYWFEGTEYSMHRHGFARNMDFKILKSDANSLVFTICHNESTLKQYPFEFNLYLTYTLLGKGLKVEYKVENKSQREMWFSIGGHPGFNCTLKPDGRKNCKLRFNERETVSYIANENGTLTGEKKPFLTEMDVLKLSELDFEGKTKVYIVKGLKSNTVTLEDGETGKKVQVKFDGFPYLGIWSPKDNAPFVCIEPWFGITCTLGVEDVLDKKRGIQKLGVNEAFTCCYEIIFG